ncbi:hypothetical protein [Acinetobacter terrestris]|uniref:hypothetical protein n=1 Tax=Acinetobacter terrestris TaxID=2529843 RepID=UPI001040B5CA|nr:hypothetical protein [Acinetobacter terrestris]TCB62524.1 hypothetical protein E0H81_12145 [Acinetobacter terrestris]
MSIFAECVNSLGVIQELTIDQTLTRFCVKGSLSAVDSSLLGNLKVLFERFNEIGVSVYLSLKNGENDTEYYSSNSFQEFESKCENFFDSYCSEDLTKFEFESKDWGDLVYIFHKETLYKYLNGLDLTQVLSEISGKFNSTKKLIFYVLESTPVISNDYFYFVDASKEFDKQTLNEWLSNTNSKDKINTRTELRDKVSHFVNAVAFQFTPECFDINLADESLKKIFNRLKTILLLIFLSDYSAIKNDNKISFKIKGYKTLQCETEGFLDTQIINELNEIYEWAYGDGPFTDKIGIARNVISIHVVGEDISTLEIGTCSSARSGYDLYLKSNVKQYIEVKNKISDMLHSQADKASSIVKDMFTMFKTSMWTFVAFFMSSVILRSTKFIADPKVDISIFIAGIAFILLSYIYIIFARHEVEIEKNRLGDKYEEIKNRYKDLLNEQDLKKILTQSDVNNRSSQEREFNYVDSKKSYYTSWWVGINTAMLIVWILIYNQITFPWVKKLLHCIGVVLQLAS